MGGRRPQLDWPLPRLLSGGAMRRLLTPCFAFALALFVVTINAQDAVAPLQGRWVVIGGEHNGKAMNTLNGGVMTITGNAFEIRTVSGNMLKGVLRLDA